MDMSLSLYLSQNLIPRAKNDGPGSQRSPYFKDFLEPLWQARSTYLQSSVF